MENLDDFKKIYDDYHLFIRKSLFRLVGPDLLDDAVQESFLKIWKNREQFKKKSSVKTWIYRVSINTSLDLIKKQKKFTSLDKIKEKGEEMKDQLIAKEIQEAVLSLPIDYRLSVNAIIFDELSFSEAAEALGAPEGTIKSRVFRGKEMLKEILSKKGYAP